MSRSALNLKLPVALTGLNEHWNVREVFSCLQESEQAEIDAIKLWVGNEAR